MVLGLIQGVAYYFYLRTNGIVAYTDGFAGVFVAVVIVLTFYGRHRPDHVDGRADQ